MLMKCVSKGLTHWGRVTHLCVSKLTSIGSDNGLSPGRRQAIIWTNDGILLIGPLGTNFSEILSEIHTFSFKKMGLKLSFRKWRPFCLGLNVSIGDKRDRCGCCYGYTIVISHNGIKTATLLSVDIYYSVFRSFNSTFTCALHSNLTNIYVKDNWKHNSVCDDMLQYKFPKVHLIRFGIHY